jgi:hypothetical protein
MQKQENIWGPIFAIFCVLLAVVHLLPSKDLWGFEVKVDGLVVGLLALSTLPWSLPWMASFVETLKVGGTEWKFRQQQLEKKVAEQETAVAAALGSGVGNPTPAAVRSGSDSGDLKSHATPEAPDEPEDDADSSAPAPESRIRSRELWNSDPHKGNFGGKPVAGPYRLSAEVKPFPGSQELFLIRASVISTNPAQPLLSPVTFYLHPTFPVATRKVMPVLNEATLDCVSFGAFTLGAVVEAVPKDIRLELDLSREVPLAPAAFIAE